MDSIKLEFRDEKEAKEFVKKIKKISKQNKFLTINHLYLLYRVDTGTTIRPDIDDSLYGWTYALMSGATFTKDGVVIMPPNFIKLTKRSL